MCGLVGVYGEIDDEIKSIFRWMLYLDVLRGPHSTGVTTVNKEGNVNTYKEVGLPHMVWLGYPDVFSHSGIPQGDVELLMGHNRWATKGEINKDNAHPFTFGHITGAHNGTLSDYDVRSMQEHERFSVDSQVIFRNIELSGPKFVWDKAFGAMALSWWDNKEKTLNLLRNNQRPLFMWRYRNAVLWASEKWIIETARGQAGCNVRIAPTEVPVNTLHSFFYINGKLGVTTENLRPFLARQADTSNVTHINAGGKNRTEYIYLKIHTFVPETFSKNSTGHFISSRVDKEVDIEYVTHLYAGSLEDSEKAKKAIYKHNAKDGAIWKIDKTKCYQIQGLIAAPWRCLEPSTMAEKEESEKKKDFLGSEIEYDDWRFATIDGCVACQSPIRLKEWKDVHKYIVMPKDGLVFCPNCTDTEIVSKTIDHLEKSFVNNWMN